MAQQDEKHPVVAGLLALVGVGLAVGLLLGLVALGATRVLGLGGGGGGDAAADSGATLYLPDPVPTTGPSGPLVTLAPDAGASATPSGSPSASASASPSAEPKKEITLQAGQTEVSPMENIDLSGVYPQGEGAILQVQRLVDGQWEDFLSIDVAVSGGQFSTYIQTGRTGVQQFRMRDTDSGLTSNVVKVTVR